MRSSLARYKNATVTARLGITPNLVQEISSVIFQTTLVRLFHSLMVSIKDQNVHTRSRSSPE